MSKGRHIPIRKCAGCGEKKSKENFIRIVCSKKDSDKRIFLDSGYKADGRGVYICRNLSCLKKVRKIRRLERTFSCKIEEELYDKIEREISEFE